MQMSTIQSDLLMSVIWCVLVLGAHISGLLSMCWDVTAPWSPEEKMSTQDWRKETRNVSDLHLWGEKVSPLLFWAICPLCPERDFILLNGEHVLWTLWCIARIMRIPAACHGLIPNNKDTSACCGVWEEPVQRNAIGSDLCPFLCLGLRATARWTRWQASIHV